MTTISNYARYYMTIMMIMSISIISYAGTITVDSTNATNGTLSLRSAVSMAVSGDTIRFSSAIDGDTIKLATEITLDKNLVIIGNDTTNTIIDGMGNSRIFHITAGDTVSISGIKMQEGNGASPNQPFSGTSGGAIYNQGSLTLTNSTVSGNTATFGGGISNFGTLTLTNSTVSGNSAVVGGGIDNFSGIVTLTNSTVSGNSDGGGILNRATMTLTNSTVSGNSETGVLNVGTLTLTNSTVSGNSADSDGGGISNVGTLTLTNSTVSGNSITNGDGGGISNFGTLTLTNSTVSGNSASNGFGGGIENSGTLTLTNSIVAKNSASSDPDISNIGTLNDGGHNLIGDGTGQTAIVAGINGNQVGTTATPLDPIFITDVPVATSTGGDLRLQCGSPAIDAGKLDTTGLNLGLVDILGLPRIESAGGTIDIGAHERPADTGSKIVTTLADDGQGSLRDLVRTACTGDTIRFDVSLNMDTIKLITEIVIDTNLVIIGNDTTNTIIDGMNTSRIFHIPAGDTVSISGIKMQGGNGDGVQFMNATNNTGGAIFNRGFLILANSILTGNNALGISAGGALSNLGTVIVTDCIFSHNTAAAGAGFANGGIATLINSIFHRNSSLSLGGGLSNFGLGHSTVINSTFSDNSAVNDGGGIHNSLGIVVVTNSSLSSNDSRFGGGLYNGSSGKVTLTNTTLNGNIATQRGGGLYNEDSGSAVTLINSIVSGNAAMGDGGGLSNRFGSRVTLTNSTLSGNTADRFGGGLYNESTGSIATLTNTIIAKNNDNGSGPDIYKLSGTITDQGNNLIGNTTSVGADFTMSTLLGNTAIPVDPLFVLDVPTNDSLGGDLRLKCGSPAIDAGKADTTGLNLGLVDLGGNPRIITKTIDIGAYELQASDAPAPTTLVTNANDSGCGSLRFAVCNAMAGDTIRFDASLDMDTIKLITEIVIDTNLVIIGNDTTNTIIDGMNTSRIFHIPAGDTVSISGIKMQGGNGASPIQPFIAGSSTYGGAIYNQGTLTLTNCKLSGNLSHHRGGAVYNSSTFSCTNTTLSSNSSIHGGGLYSAGTFSSVEMSNCTVIGNSAFIGAGVANNDSGSAIISDCMFIDNIGTGNGSGVYNTGQLTLTNSQFFGNKTDSDESQAYGGGVYNSGMAILSNIKFVENLAISGGGIANSGTMTMVKSSVSANSAIFPFGNGGGVYNTGILAMTNSTISGNTASSSGGGIDNLGEMMLTNGIISGNKAESDGGGVNNASSSTLTLTNSTVSGNSTSRLGGGIYNRIGTLMLTNSIVAKNTDNGSGPDIYKDGGTITDEGHNVIGDTTSVGSDFMISTLLGNTANPVDPLFVLDVPANDSLGGDLSLRICSPAIDAGLIAAVPKDTFDIDMDLDSMEILPLDLAGQDRVFGTAVDIGAYETQQLTTDPLVVMNTNDDGPQSLRYLVDIACAGDTITFDASLDMDTIKLITEIVIDTNLVILGNDTTNTIIDGMANSRLFYIPLGDTVYISGMTLRNGNGIGAIDLEEGGAILNKGVVHIANCRINANSARRQGGGIYSQGTVTLVDSEVSDNFAFTIGGVGNDNGMLMVVNSRINSNIAGGTGSGGLSNNGMAIITNSTISGNQAAIGGGLLNSGTMTFTNGIISGNVANVSRAGGLLNSGAITVINTTISGNFSRSGGGGMVSNGTMLMANSIIAKNTSSLGADITATGGITDWGHNLIGDTTEVANLFSVSTLKGGAGINALDPLFIMDVPTAPSTGGDLRLQCGSPAIDAGTPDTMGLNLGLVDILGLPRIESAGGTIDIGAHERPADMGSKIVTTLADDGQGSLRDIVGTACPGDTITFAANLTMDTINLITEITLDKNLVIIGEGISNTIVSGSDNSRIFHIPSGDTVQILGITMTDGNETGTGTFARGGAIFNQGNLHIADCLITNNMVTASDAFGGGISNDGTLTIINSTVSGNQVSGNGFAQGGGIQSCKSLTIINSAVTGNIAQANGAFGGGIEVSPTCNAKVQILNSTISGNTANGASNSLGGGISTGGGEEYIIIVNSIIAKNNGTSGVFGPDVNTFQLGIDGGNNLIGDTSNVGSFFTLSTLVGNSTVPLDPLFVTDVDMTSLPNSTGDLRPRICSPAIDAGKDTMGLNLGLIDLAGEDRVFGTAVDIGAYETQQLTTDPLVVMNTNDDGPQSLRYLVDIACPGDTIRFDASLDMDTIKLITEIVIDTNLVIIGNDTTNTIIDGMNTSRIFHIPAGDTVSISDIKMQRGNGTGSTLTGKGGAILNEGTSTFTNTTISGNTASGSGGGVSNFSAGTSTFINTTISGNMAFQGGGVHNFFGTSTFSNTTITGNTSNFGGGLYVGSSGTSILTNTTISGNTASGSGGGVYNQGTSTFTNTTISGNAASFNGGAILNQGPSTFTNTTISGNTSREGGGVYNLSGTSTFTNTTISGNTASLDGGGIYNVGMLTLTNSIVAKNTDNGSGPDVFNDRGTINDGGHNLIGDNTSVATEFPAGLFVGMTGSEVDPLFITDVDTMSLPNNTGDLRLRICSPAVDAGLNSALPKDTFDIDMDLDSMEMLPLDLTGEDRVFSTAVDIGAYETQQSSADPLIVMNADDDGPMSLRYLVDIACAGDTIRFDSGIDGDTIRLSSGEITLDTTLVIIGNGSSNTIIDGMSNNRIFYIPPADTVTITGVTIQNGNGAGTRYNGLGGAIYNRGLLSIRQSNISGHQASDAGGGIYNSGSLELSNSVIKGNLAQLGGGLYNDPGTLIMINSTVSGNSATNIGGGLFSLNGTIALINNIIAQNTDGGDGPDIFNRDILIDGGHNLIGDTTNVSTNFMMSTLLGNMTVPLDPQFVTPVDLMSLPNASGDLRLGCGSPAIDAGTPDTSGLNLGAVDFGGFARVSGKRIDIGAHEAIADCHEIDLLDMNSMSIPDSATIVFGQVTVVTTDTIYIKNIGAHQIFIDSITIASIGTNTGSYTYNTTSFTQPDTIACGDSLLLSITFDPQALGVDSALLRIYNNDADEGVYDLILSGAKTTALTAPIISGPLAVCSNGVWSTQPQALGTSYQWKFDNIPINAPSASTANLNYIPPYDGMLSVEISNTFEQLSASQGVLLTEPELCELLKCDEVRLYLDGEFLNHENIQTDVRVISSIQSNGTVNSDEFFRFYAGDSIVLLELFEVELGGVFEAQIESCQTMNTLMDSWSEEEQKGTKEERKARIIRAIRSLKD